MRVFITILLGVFSSITIHGNWLVTSNMAWTDVLLNSDFFEYVAKNCHDGVAYTLISSWFLLPLLLPFTLIQAVVVCTLNRIRLFCYTVIATSAFMFFILPKLPIFDILLDGTDSFLVIMFKKIVPLGLFMIMFYVFSMAAKKMIRSLRNDSRAVVYPDK